MTKVAACSGGTVRGAGHKAKNLVPEAGGRPTQVGKAVTALQQDLPKARVVYCSATGARQVAGPCCAAVRRTALRHIALRRGIVVLDFVVSPLPGVLAAACLCIALCSLPGMPAEV
jgi:hypothetical protein